MQSHKNMRFRCSFLRAVCLAAIVTHVGTAQTIEPTEPMRLQVDYARFRGDETNMFVEVYYSFPQRSITYKSEAEGLKGGVDVTMMVMMKDSMVHGDRWMVPHTLKDTNGSKSGMNLVGITSVGLPEGEYTLKMVGRDRHNLSRKDSMNMRLPVKMVGQEKMVISDVELATNIKQGGNKTSPFYKNTLEVVPTPEGLFSEDQRCFFYAEAYNLLATGDRSDYYVKVVVLDAIGREVVSRERVRKRSGESAVLVDNLTMDQFKSGTYSLLVGLMDSSKKVISSAGKKFYVYNRKLGVDSSLLASPRSGSLGEYAGVEEPELDKEFEWARYEATDAEKNQFKPLQSADAKRKFLADFWERRPLGFKQEYLKRVGYANSHFHILGRQGYLTDRGRVYVTYGPPDDNDRHPSESEFRPYEIWTFQNIQGGVIFVFVQRSSSGDYELVHSTHRNELRDDNWARYAQTR
ncbi:MAG: GWxTD protein [Bacteroidetes bacterium]|nr:GWxTD protein [Bacteroidota bacterium]